MARRNMAVCIMVVILHQQFGISESCPIFGTNQTKPLKNAGKSKLLLNFQSPSQCSGTVTGWNFCFYRSRKIDTENHVALSSTFMVYRRLFTSDLYHVVPNSRKRITLTKKIYEAFSCMNYSLTNSEYFQIKENDIIAVCMPQKGTGNHNPLKIAGHQATVTTLTYQSPTFTACSSSKFNQINVPTFNLHSDTIIHANAYIDTAFIPKCKLGNNPTSGDFIKASYATYLNTLHPASCDLTIAQWHYCYYTKAAPPGSILSMTIAVWSFDMTTNTYTVNLSSIRNITVQLVQTYAPIFCDKVLLTEADYISVSQGAVVGVAIPSENDIPVLGYDSYSENYMMESSNFLSISVQEMSIKYQWILHLYGTSSDKYQVSTESIAFSTTSVKSTLKSSQLVSKSAELASTLVEYSSANPDTESTLFQQVSAISVVVVVMLLFTASIASLVVIPCRKWYKDRKHDIQPDSNPHNTDQSEIGISSNAAYAIVPLEMRDITLSSTSEDGQQHDSIYDYVI